MKNEICVSEVAGVASRQIVPASETDGGNHGVFRTDNPTLLLASGTQPGSNSSGVEIESENAVGGDLDEPVDRHLQCIPPATAGQSQGSVLQLGNGDGSDGGLVSVSRKPRKHALVRI